MPLGNLRVLCDSHVLSTYATECSQDISSEHYELADGFRISHGRDKHSLSLEQQA